MYRVGRCPCDSRREGSLYSDVAVLQPAPHPRERSKPLLLNPCFEIVQKLAWSLAQFTATSRLPLGQLPGVPSAAVKTEKQTEYHSTLFTCPVWAVLPTPGAAGWPLGLVDPAKPLCQVSRICHEIGTQKSSWLFILAVHHSGGITKGTVCDSEPSPAFHIMGGFSSRCPHPPLIIADVELGGCYFCLMQ